MDNGINERSRDKKFDQCRKELENSRDNTSPNRIVMVTSDNIVLIDALDFDWALRKSLPWEIFINNIYHGKLDNITTWLEDNCTGRYYQLYNKFLFQDKNDAVRFKLVWS